MGNCWSRVPEVPVRDAEPQNIEKEETAKKPEVPVRNAEPQNAKKEEAAKKQRYNPEPHTVKLPRGVLLFKHCLSEEEQKEKLRTCLRLSEVGGNQALKKREVWGTHAATPLCFYNWPARRSSLSAFIKDELIIKDAMKLLQFGIEMFKRGHRAATEDLDDTENEMKDRRLICPAEYTPDALYAILYPQNGRFGSHLDGCKGWVLAVSVGSSALFFYSKTRAGSRNYVRIDSGDVLVFNGGSLFHGVSDVLRFSDPDNQVPDWWEAEMEAAGKSGMARLNLQLRDPVLDRLSYDPQFPEGGTEANPNYPNG